MKRRGFLQSFGAVPLTPLFLESSAAQAAPNETGQTVHLAGYATGLHYEQIPEEVLQRSKDCIADTVAVILFGGQFPWSKMIVAQARRMGGNGKATILGTGARVCAPAAALAHGAMAHAFEQDNLTLPDSGAHPGASLVSSALAVAQEHGGSGRDFLAAFVAGSEVMIRIGRATKRTNEARGFHAPGTVGTFGAAIATGKLLGLDGAQMTNALGIAGSTSGGLLEFSRSGDGAMVKRLHLGRAAEGGVLAASLAADGFTGPSTVIEGPAGFLRAFCNETDLSQLTAGLGKEFSSMTIMLKRFACHITAHTAVEAIIDLRGKHGFSANDVASVEIEGSRRMATVNSIAKPADILIAQFSIPFCVALALHRNAVDPYAFDEASPRDAGILASMATIKMNAAPGQPDDDVASSVTVKLKDGRVLTQRVTDFLGTPARPLSGAAMHEKFMLLTQKYPVKQMERIYQRIQSLETEASLGWLHI